MGTTPIDRSTTWPYDDGEPGAFTYSRFSSPTIAEAERRLGELDGGEALLFASGAAACTSVALALLAPGQTVALAEGAYYGTGVMLDELVRWGVETVEFDQTGAPPDGVDLVWLEAPSNPFLTLPDFESAAAHPARVVCDATAATPLHVRPLEHGCDLVVHSATKYLAGHDDALLGVVVCKSSDDAARLLAVPLAHGARAECGHCLASPAWPEHARGPHGPTDGDGDHDRRSSPRAPGGRDRALSGIRRASCPSTSPTRIPPAASKPRRA